MATKAEISHAKIMRFCAQTFAITSLVAVCGNNSTIRILPTAKAIITVLCSFDYLFVAVLGLFGIFGDSRYPPLIVLGLFRGGAVLSGQGDRLDCLELDRIEVSR